MAKSTNASKYWTQSVQLLQNIEQREGRAQKRSNSKTKLPHLLSSWVQPADPNDLCKSGCQNAGINRHDCREVITHLLVKSRHGKTMRSTWTIHDISRKVLAVFIENKIIYYLCAVQFLKDCEYSNSKIHTLYLLVVFWKYRNYRCQGQAPAVCWATSWTPLQRRIVQHLNCTNVKRKWYSLGNKVEVISFHQ